MRTLTVCFAGSDEVLDVSEDVSLVVSGRLELGSLEELEETADELNCVLMLLVVFTPALVLVAQAANEMHSAKIKILQIIRFVINRLDVV
jgi:hypothetical protein